MDRKHFLARAGSVVAGSLISSSMLPVPEDDPPAPFRKPPALKPGHVIGITSPAGFITHEDIRPAVEVLEKWGFRVQVGATIGARDFTFGGTDEERLKDFQQMLDD
ncbi:MAG TPA: LD-carboxypeptidase, partial [Flavisolibacter sp.]